MWLLVYLAVTNTSFKKMFKKMGKLMRGNARIRYRS